MTTPKNRQRNSALDNGSIDSQKRIESNDQDIMTLRCVVRDLLMYSDSEGPAEFVGQSVFRIDPQWAESVADGNMTTATAIMLTLDDAFEKGGWYQGLQKRQKAIARFLRYGALQSEPIRRSIVINKDLAQQIANGKMEAFEAFLWSYEQSLELGLPQESGDTQFEGELARGELDFGNLF